MSPLPPLSKLLAHPSKHDAPDQGGSPPAGHYLRVSASVAVLYAWYYALTGSYIAFDAPQCYGLLGFGEPEPYPGPAAMGVSVFYSISVPVTVSALAVAAQLNRPLLHNWHYWISMTGMAVAVLAGLVPWMLVRRLGERVLCCRIRNFRSYIRSFM